MDVESAQQQPKGEVVFPFIYGTLSFWLGKKAQSSYTHRWMGYVRGVNGQDLSYLIKKVVFKLHSSFQNPVKQVYKPPYEFQEVGWGEFEILIQIHFNHPDMPCVELPHMLRLHHTHTTGSQQSKKPLCSQCYDQVVFTKMDEHLEKIIQEKNNMQAQLMHSQSQHANEQEGGGIQPDQPLKSITEYTRFYSTLDAADHRQKLEDAYRFIKGQISSLQQKMRIADLDIQKVYEQIYNKTT